MICLYGRELTGDRSTRIVPALRSRNYSVSCTISCEGMVNFKIIERAYKAEYFLEYFLEIFEIFRVREISEAYLVMDNVPFHKTEFHYQSGITACFMCSVYVSELKIDNIEQHFTKIMLTLLQISDNF
ncbi:hypothetical protein RF11_07029 [Thelohanellus kitauei]|uniref:Tc1-like transposase DDE domain-containing protein n=1 Tax=Thelohanellus kitauei TaxID=669202 RepID=A0A0C2JYZ8_THEKT|nr:hypothetical protein RF11_07029 [Thelohanellus kitauei]